MVQEQTPSTERRDEVIDLTALAGTRAVVRIDGQSFDLVDVDELGLRDRAKLTRTLERIAALEGAAREDLATDDDETEYRQRLSEFARIALPGAPEELLAKLNDGQKGDLAAAFFVEAIGQKKGRLGLLSRIGPRSSPGSASTTAETTG